MLTKMPFPHWELQGRLDTTIYSKVKRIRRVADPAEVVMLAQL